MLSNPKFYEIAFLIKNPEEEKTVADLINQYKGKVFQKSPLKEVKLAYPIKKHTTAYFGYVQFELLPANIEKISQSLKLNSLVLRYLTITPPIMKRERRVENKEFVKPLAAAPKQALSNVALEEKLKEILK